MRRLCLYAVLTGAAVLAVFAPAPARAVEYLDIQISRADDLLMSCHEISQEISLMETIIQQSQLTQGKAELTSTGVGVAKTVASYFIGSLGGALGILAAGYLVNEATDDRADNAKTLENLAKQRRSFMVGIYNARTCVGPLDLASIEPAAGMPSPAPISVSEPRPRDARFNYNE